MSEPLRPLDLVMIWHHHQPDYRRPGDRTSLLPWVRLHASKDYLDMAVRLERHPRIHATFNFVPSLLDQIEDALADSKDALFELIARPVESLSGAERTELVVRCSLAPRHAYDRWPAYRDLARRLAPAAKPHGPIADADMLKLETWFLLAWIDPMFLGEPAAAGVLAAAPAFKAEHRDALLRLHRELLARVIPAYRARAEAGQIELTESPYYHPILPLLHDLRIARRAAPQLPLPHEPFAAPEDAAHQVERALERHVRAFGSRPAGMWPPEGGVSPEVVILAARLGLKWIATDEGVLWHSVEADARHRASLYRPWRIVTDAGETAVFFRDHELSDRIGFVYQNWSADDAVRDFLERLRRIAREAPAGEVPVVSVILDGENCWEYYPDDGAPFLERLYTAIAESTDIRTRTPSEVLAERGAELPRLERLHSGSWIDADFHIWIGHPEKNRAWELVCRARRALVDRGVTPASHPAAWEALYKAEGSDWFWWFGDDHHTSDKILFDRLFRSHLRGIYEACGMAPPAWLEVPIARAARRVDPEREPLGFIHPVIDGKRTGYYEWHGAGRLRAGSGGSMHHGAGFVAEVQYGYDADCLYLRVDFTEGPPGASHDLELDLVAPHVAQIVVRGLAPGTPEVRWVGGEWNGGIVRGASSALGVLLEVALPFASLGVTPGQQVEMVGRLKNAGEPVENVPADDMVRFKAPGAHDAAAMWSA